MRSHRGYIPHLLRMTRSHRSSKNSKLFLEPWDRNVGRRAVYRTSSHTPDLFFQYFFLPSLDNSPSFVVFYI